MPIPTALAVLGLFPTLRKLATTHRVSFKARKKVKVPAKVDFTTKDGRTVRFKARKTVKKRVPVSFRAKNKPR
ncbi:MAG: hypothetical protein JOZ72_15940 [Alphaproteobacteria bacterium]|nr:hypothetical protein [Alphaproteobacteria bacterium]